MIRDQLYLFSSDEVKKDIKIYSSGKTMEETEIFRRDETKEKANGTVGINSGLNLVFRRNEIKKYTEISSTGEIKTSLNI